MKTLTLLVLLLFTVAHCIAEETNRLTQTGTDIIFRLAKIGNSRYPLTLAGGHPLAQTDDNGKIPVLVMEPLQSDAVRQLFPKLICYRLISSDNRIHYAQFSALLLDTNGSPIHLQSDEEAASFLSGMTRKVMTEADVKLLIQAFADLRSYKITQERPKIVDPRAPDEVPPQLPTDFKFFIEDKKGEWRIYATLFTSEYSYSFKRYVFTIYKHPGSGIDIAKPVLILLGQYVY